MKKSNNQTFIGKYIKIFNELTIIHLRHIHIFNTVIMTGKINDVSRNGFRINKIRNLAFP